MQQLRSVTNLPGNLRRAREVAGHLSNMRGLDRGNQYTDFEKLPLNIRKAAEFAQAAYSAPQKNIAGFKLDEALSTPQFRVYTTPREVYFAIRGSKELWNDFVVNDSAIMMGAQHKQLDEARRKFDEVKKKYPRRRKTITGHSLGGFTSAILGKENKTPAYVFNPGSSPLGDKKFHKLMEEAFGDKHVRTIIAEGDLVSATAGTYARSTNLHVIKNPSFNLKTTIDRHLMSNFTTRAGIGDQGIDIGPTLASGGFHARYDATNNTTKLDGYDVPCPGARVYVDRNRMFILDKYGNEINLTGTLEEKAETFKQAINYGKGPSLLVNCFTGRQMGFVPAIGGRGLVPTFANTKEEYRYLLGGESLTGGAKFWSGSVHGEGYIGNGLINFFVANDKIRQTYDDRIGDGVTMGAEVVYSHIMDLVKIGAEFAAQEVLGPEAKQMVDNFFNLIGGGQDIQKTLNEQLGDRHHEFETYTLRTSGEYDANNTYLPLQDPYYLKAMERKTNVAWQRLKTKLNKSDLSEEQKKDFLKYAPHHVDNNADSFGYLRDIIEKYKLIDEKMGQRLRLQNMRKIAYEYGREREIDDAMLELDRELFPPHGISTEYEINQMRKSLHEHVDQTENELHQFMHDNHRIRTFRETPQVFRRMESSAVNKKFWSSFSGQLTNADLSKARFVRSEGKKNSTTNNKKDG